MCVQRKHLRKIITFMFENYVDFYPEFDVVN